MTTAPVAAPTGPTELSFQLDWVFSARFAGLLVADAFGYFADADISMDIRPWTDGLNAVTEVVEGRADFACADQSLILQAQADGAPIKAVATVFQTSPFGLMAPPGTGLTSLEVLRNQPVGVHVDGVNVMALIQGVNGISGINVTEVPYADKWDRTVAGEFGAVQCYVFDEPIGIAARYGVEPEVIQLTDFGLQGAAQTIVVSDDTLEEKGDMVRDVLAAIFDGWDEALACKESTAALIVDEYVPDGSIYKDVAFQNRSLELIEPFVLGNGGPIGVIDVAAWDASTELMLEFGIIDCLPDLNSTFDLDFLVFDEEE